MDLQILHTNHNKHKHRCVILEIHKQLNNQIKIKYDLFLNKKKQ